MRNEEIIDKINALPEQCFPLCNFIDELQQIKAKYVRQDLQDAAKQIWIYQTIVKIHYLYIEAFDLLKNKEHYKGWCKLEKIEIELGFLKNHYQYDQNSFCLHQIEKTVKNLQVIFPYRLFASSEMLIQEEKCSICNQVVSIRKPCEHIIGEIYNGELCHRIISKCKLLGFSVVPNPEHKYAVLFISNQDGEVQKDHYDYSVLNALFKKLNNPYDNWDLRVYQYTITKNHYDNIHRNDLCICSSGKKFKECCALNIGKKFPHYEFIFYKSPR